MAGSCQFVGKEQVLAAFESRNVEAWAVFQGKQFIHKGYGSEDLSAFLDMLKEGGSNATYTVKVFEGLKDESSIKEKTECDGSYNFKINAPNEGVAGTGYFNNRGNDLILQRLQAIEEKLEEQPEQNEPESIGAIVHTAIIDVIRDPNKALQWAEIFKGIFTPGKVSPGQEPAILRQIPGPASPAAVGAADTTESRETRFLNAINTLEALDSNLIEHLEKLAEIASKKPKAFKNLLSMLENF